MIKAILFDMDGTLIDTEKYLTVFLKRAIEEQGFRIDIEEIYKLRSLASDETKKYLDKKLGENFNYQKVRERRRELMAEHVRNNGIELKPYAREVLEDLKEKGYMRVVVTATNEKTALSYLDMAGITKLFDHVVSAHMVKNGKPAPDVYLYACEKIGEKPSDCISVEDSPNGVLSAKRAGCRVIMIPDLTEADDDVTKNTDYVLENLREISEVV